MRSCISILLIYIFLPVAKGQADTCHQVDLNRKLELVCEEFGIHNPVPQSNTLIQSRTLRDNPVAATYWKWNEKEKNWQLNHKESSVYNPSNQLIELINRKWIEDEWKDEYRAYFLYTDRDLLRMFQYETWEYNDWHLYTRYVNDYDSNDSLVNENLEDWIGNEWIVRSRKQHVYSLHPLYHQVTDQQFHSALWCNQNRETDYYDTPYQVKTKVEERWNGVRWENVLRQQYDYNKDFQVSCIIAQVWDNDHWTDATSTNFQYDQQGNVITQTVHFLQPSTLQQDFAWNLEYDQDGNLLESSFWVLNGSTWEVRSRNVYTYDAQRRLVSTLSQSYSYFWTNADFVEYEYSSINGTSETDLNSLIQVFPNPASDKIIIKANEDPGPIQIDIFSPSGILYQSIKSTGEVQVEIPVEYMAAGLYYVKIKGERSYCTRTFFKN